MKVKKLSELADRILDVAILIETLRDASIGIDNNVHAHVLEIALKQQECIYDEFETMYK